MSTTTTPGAPPAHHKPSLPASVQRQIAEVQQHFDSGGDAPAPAPAPGDPPDLPTMPGTPAPAPPPVQPLPDPGGPAVVDWKHRYDSLKGKHDAETARLAGEISGLHKVLAAVSPAPLPNAPAPSSAAPAATPGVRAADLTFTPLSDAERTDYGEEFLSVAERAAMQRLAPVMQELRDKVTGLESQIGGVSRVVAQDARQTAMDYLARAVPDYAALDTDPGFVAWLAAPDEFSGHVRQNLLDSAVASNNGPRIAAFFNAYKGLGAAGAPASPPAPPAPRRTTLETLAAPGRGRAGAGMAPPASGPGNGAFYTQASIRQFYDDVRRGLYARDPAGKARIEADIVAAAGEGRIAS